jgi:putative transposase
MDEKLRFVSRHLEGESISQLCREFGISRVTGHKLVERYRQNGLEAFSDRSRRPYRMANQLPLQVEALIVQIKNEFPTWGAPKIRERLLARYPEIKTPAKSTVHAVLERNLLVKHKRANARPNLGAKQNIPFSWRASAGTTCKTSQCSMIFPSASKRKMSMPAQSLFASVGQT